VLFALRHPAILLGLLLGFLIGVIARAALQQQLASGAGLSLGRPRLRSVGRARPAARWGAYLDPYGAVAAVIAGVGWGVRPPARAGRGALGLLAVALGVHGALAVVGFAAYKALSGPPVLGHLVHVSDVLHGSLSLGSSGAQIAVGFGMENLACGLLALVPIPPLELGVLLWSRLPRTPGARRVAYHLLEEAWGVAVILVGLLLPLAGQSPALLALLDIVGDPLLRLT
jgi:hypothetical protein